MKCQDGCGLDVPENHANFTLMSHKEINGTKYRLIKGKSWSELADLERVYINRGYKTFLDFGNLCDDTYTLTIEMRRAA